MTCFECGAGGPIHDHHVVPRSSGGTKTVPLCERCHGLVHDRALTGHSFLTRSALARKRGEGKRTSRDAPYGWKIDADGDTLVMNDEEQRIVALVKMLRRGGMSVRAIVDHLDESNVCARGSRWHKTTIERMLQRYSQ